MLDACQAVGQIPVEVTKLRCDFLRPPRGSSCAGHAESDSCSCRTQRSTGDGIRSRSTRRVRDGRGTSFELVPTAQRYENWEFAYALVLGLGAAARYALALKRARKCKRRSRGSANNQHRSIVVGARTDDMAKPVLSLKIGIQHVIDSRSPREPGALRAGLERRGIACLPVAVKISITRSNSPASHPRGAIWECAEAAAAVATAWSAPFVASSRAPRVRSLRCVNARVGESAA